MTSSEAGDDRLVLVARVRRPWGRHGELLVEPETDWPEIRFRPGSRLLARLRGGERRELEIRGVVRRGPRMMLALEGVDSIDGAEPLAGAELLAPRGGARLDEGEVHVADLTGLAVELPDGTPVGQVVGVLEGVGSDLLVMRDTRGNEHLVPLAPEITRLVDPEGGRVVIDPPPGLIDSSDRPGEGSGEDR